MNIYNFIYLYIFYDVGAFYGICLIYNVFPPHYLLVFVLRFRFEKHFKNKKFLTLLNVFSFYFTVNGCTNHARIFYSCLFFVNDILIAL